MPDSASSSEFQPAADLAGAVAGQVGEEQTEETREPTGVVVVRGPDAGEQEPETIQQPAKVMRIGSMIKQLLEEVRQAPLDEASRGRMRDVYMTSIKELSDGLSEDLREELERLVLPFDMEETPSEGELRIAQAQLVGWLEGLFHGIQATLMAQQMAARQQLEEMRRNSLPAGPSRRGDDQSAPGVYL